MARVTFALPIVNLTGKVDKSSNFSHRTSYGTKHTYTWNPNTVIRDTPARLIHREALAEANAFASAVLATEDATGHWHQAYRKSDYKGPINSFIIREVLPDIKARLRREWNDRPLAEIQAFVAQQKSSRRKSSAPSSL